MKSSVLLVVFASLLLAGCATDRIDWQSRLGQYTFDQAVLEMGPPDKVAELKDGTKVAEWLTSRGRSMGGSLIVTRGFIHHLSDYDAPDYYIRLSFDPEGRLTNYKRVVK